MTSPRMIFAPKHPYTRPLIIEADGGYEHGGYELLDEVTAILCPQCGRHSWCEPNGGPWTHADGTSSCLDASTDHTAP